MDAGSLFKQANLNFHSLKGQLDASSGEAFIRQFREMFSQPDARSATKVVYIWVTQNALPRLRDSSNIIYIGKTEKSLFGRHARYAEIEGSSLNWERYNHIIKSFGPIIVLYAPCIDPVKTEKQFLDKFFEAHLELPPINNKS